MEIITTEISSYKHGTVSNLSKQFGVSRKTIYDAFAFRSNSELASSIRAEAINSYGARVDIKKHVL